MQEGDIEFEPESDDVEEEEESEGGGLRLTLSPATLAQDISLLRVFCLISLVPAPLKSPSSTNAQEPGKGRFIPNSLNRLSLLAVKYTCQLLLSVTGCPRSSGNVSDRVSTITW